MVPVPRFGAATIALIYAAFAVLWIVASGTVLEVATTDAVLQARLEIIKGIVFVLASSGLLYWLIRSRRESLSAFPRAALDEPETIDLRQLVVTIVLISLAVPLISFAVFSLNARQAERDTMDSLTAIARSTAGHLQGWLGERRGDAATLAASRGFIRQVIELQRDAASPERAAVLERLESLQTVFAYDAVKLFDASGTPMLAAGHAFELDERHRDLVATAIAAGEPRMGDIHRDGGGLYLSFAVPLYAEYTGEMVGVVILRSDPGHFLFPLVGSWPLPGKSGEIVLVRAEGDTVLFLNELRHGDAEALSMRVPLTDTRRAAAAALAAEGPGTLIGTDYRDQRVLAAWGLVHGTQWRLIAKIDRDEALRPAWVTAWWTAGVALLGVVFVILVVMQLFRQQRATQRMQLELQADRLLKHFYELPFVGMAITSATTHRWLRFNDHLRTMFGYTAEEFAAHTWRSLGHPDDADLGQDEFARMERGEIDAFALEKRFLRSDGSVFVGSLDVKAVRKPDGALDHIVTTVEDVTEARRAEEVLRESEERFRVLLQDVPSVAVQGYAMDGTTRYWNCASEALYGYTAGEAIGRNLLDLIIPPDRRGEMQDVMRRVAETCEPIPPSELTLMRKDGSPVTVFSAHVAVHVPGREAEMFRIDVDLTARKRDELELRARAHQQVLVATLGRLALSDTGMDEIFEAAASAVAEGLGVEFGRVLVASDEDAFIMRAGVGWEPGWVGRRVHAGMGCTHAGFVAAARGAVIIDDFRAEDHFSDSGMLAAHGIVSGIDAPIGHPDKPLGILCAYSRATHRFSFDDVGFVQSIANTLNTAIERARANERLAYMVQHDALTGLPNRLLLTDRLSVAMARAERAGKRLAVMFMDLDRFKNVNDVFGHEGGDTILQEVARRLRGSVRASDTVSRQGGDEFLIMLPEIDCDEDVARVAEKLIAAVLEPCELHGTEVVLGASIGIVCYPDNGREVESLLRNADVAMYAAKDQGRGRYQFYSAEMNARAHERLLLEADLRHALERGELFLAYQPQIDLASGNVVGLEALIRWRHPERGLVSPAQFIPIAEDCGLIMPIGAWAMETACRDHARWVSEGLVDGTMAVNVSALQFRQADFVDSVWRALDHSGLAPEKLEIEVTESVVMRGVEEVRQKLDAIDALGVKLAIDDFGTGYSSLSYLKQFPIYRLKVDQSFTRGLPDDRESAAIVQAIIGLARSLGLDVLAEGIETEAQAALLRTLFCDSGQGYLYARPMSADDCSSWLQTRAAR